MPPGVVIADDHARARQAACTLVEATPGLRLVGGVASGEEALELASCAAAPLLLVIDLRMPGMGGAEAGRRARALGRGHVVVLVSTDDELGVGLADELGMDFVSKSRLTGRRLLEIWSKCYPRTDCGELSGLVAFSP